MYARSGGRYVDESVAVPPGDLIAFINSSQLLGMRLDLIQTQLLQAQARCYTHSL